MRNNTKTQVLFRQKNVRLSVCLSVQQKQYAVLQLLEYFSHIFRALWRWGREVSLGRHVKDEHAKDAAHGMVQGAMQDVAEDELGDGSVKVFVLSIVIFQRWNPRPTHAYRPHAFPWATREERVRKGRGAFMWRRTCHRT